ncbi:hypothetical protein LUX01_12695 [Streptomyces sudanensis]|uniref:hypothetical protein n=1 Tax=Streptomyces sudanensis TaxID=436397 RepID=UPI0020CE175C|nr:hypothetical protein [Streptomyces sudanensis]MCP9987427.1 hypothetical protein [Streptomyces sudanensis]
MTNSPVPISYSSQATCEPENIREPRSYPDSAEAYVSTTVPVVTSTSARPPVLAPAGPVSYPTRARPPRTAEPVKCVASAGSPDTSRLVVAVPSLLTTWSSAVPSSFVTWASTLVGLSTAT